MISNCRGKRLCTHVYGAIFVPFWARYSLGAVSAVPNKIILFLKIANGIRIFFSDKAVFFTATNPNIFLLFKQSVDNSRQFVTYFFNPSVSQQGS